MKKIFAVLLAALMLMSLSVTAFAAELPANATDDAKSKDVTAEYVGATSGGVVYKVDIEWGSMEFTYTAASNGNWDPDSHTYTGATEAKWTYTEGANAVKVTNHSNADVTVNITNTNVIEGITFTWDKTSLSLTTADNATAEGEAGTPTTDTAKLTVSGDLTETEEKVTIGTVTLTLNEG